MMNASELTPKDILVLGTLLAVLLTLLVVLGVIVRPPLVRYYRWRISVTKKHIARRKQTIRAWLVTKVSVFGCGDLDIVIHVRFSPCSFYRVSAHLRARALRVS